MERQQMQVEPGASVEARDGRLGSVDEVIVRPETGEVAYLVVRRGWSDEQLMIPADMIEAIPSAREVRLRATREEARTQTASVPPEALVRAAGSELRVPLIEERLVISKRIVDQGELRVHRHIEEREEVVSQPVTRDDLIVERVPINRPLEAPVDSRYEGEWLVVPIMEEVLVVQKRLMLKEELRIRKRQVTEEQEVREILRRQRVELEDATVRGIHQREAPAETAALGVVREEEAPDASLARTKAMRTLPEQP